MTAFEAFILGVIQGLTEFLPVSSSGHLHLAQHLLGLDVLDNYIFFDLICHLGTLLAILYVFFPTIKNLFSLSSTKLWQIGLAILPLFPLLIIMKPIKAFYADPSYLGFFFLLTAGILFLGIYFGKTLSPIQRQQHTWRDALIIGTWQAIAILPGVSRSGSTITGARLLGWDVKEAVTFSFLLAVPTILGATLLESLKLWKQTDRSVDLPIEQYLIGFFVSFVVGLGALRLLMILATQNKFSYFAWYCLFLGLATLGYFYL